MQPTARAAHTWTGGEEARTADAQRRVAAAGWPFDARIRAAAVGLALLGGVIWSYWPVVRDLVREWRNDDNYSIGLLVPFAVLYLLWHDRARLARHRLKPWLGGAAVILSAQGARVVGLVFLYESIERYSLVLTVMGVVLLVGGRGMFRRTFWALMFLFLMVPLPGRVHNEISGPLQGLATRGAVFTLELLGASVERDGNTMTLGGDTQVAVAEACSGLRMLTAFVVVAGMLAYLAKRPRWQKVVLIVSSVPVAILCNLVRLVGTAVLLTVASSEVAYAFFHDFAGLTMMPLAVLILLGELWLMSCLVIEANHERVQSGV